MRSLLLFITFLSTNSWAGVQVQHCSSANNSGVRLCINLTQNIGKLDFNAEKFLLQFSGEDTLTSTFTLPSSGQIGTINIFAREATLQFADENPILLTCEIPKPGSCLK